MFAFCISILTGVFFGLAPALQTAGAGQIIALREGSQGSGASKHQLKFSRFLVASEIALSLVLLIGAGLLLRSFWHLLEVRPGFEPHHLVTAKIWLAVPNDPLEDPYRLPEKRAAFHQEILRRVSALPGVEQAALGNAASLPMDARHFQLPFAIENRALDSESTLVAEIASVAPAYFSVLKTPLISGRFFSDSDDTKGQQVALIDETLARRYWPGSEVVGQRLRLGIRRNQASASQSPWLTIVGVVVDTKHRSSTESTQPQLYLAHYQQPQIFSSLVARTLRPRRDPGTLEAVRAESGRGPTIPSLASAPWTSSSLPTSPSAALH